MMMRVGQWVQRRKTKWSSFLLFLIGTFSETKIFVFGCLGISELAVFLVAPFVFLRDRNAMRREGFMPFVWMISGVVVSLLISSKVNHTPDVFTIKRFAVIYSILSYFIVLYHLLKTNLKGIRWVLAGMFVSSIITIFAFNPTVQVTESGQGFIGNMEADAVMESALFWVYRAKYLMQIPVCGFYFSTPLIFSLLTPIIYIIIAAKTTVSGRAASIALLVSGAMMAVGRKRRKSMRVIGKHFIFWAFIGFISLFLIKSTYSYAAHNGLMGEDAKLKYEQQKEKQMEFGKESLIGMLMVGRSEFFVALTAVLDRPFIGFGPSPDDTKGYKERFVLMHGNAKDIERFYAVKRTNALFGYRSGIPSHSHILGAWMTYGIFGLLYYLWVLYLFFVHIKKYSAAIPQWYGFFAMMLPYYMWNVFFSPVGQRLPYALLMVCLFFARSVGERRMSLPYDMEEEAIRYDK